MEGEKGIATIACNSLELRLVDGYRFSEFRRNERHVPLVVQSGYYELDGQRADIAVVPASRAAEHSVQLSLSTEQRDADLYIEGGEQIKLCAEGGDKASRFSVTLAVPTDSRIHLAETVNTGRLLSSAMPTHESYSAALFYNTLAIEFAEFVVSIRLLHERTGLLGCDVRRYSRHFELTLTWPVGTTLALDGHDSICAAVSWMADTLSREHGAVPFAAPQRAPIAWTANVPAVVTCDMLRSDWSVSNSYDDVAMLAAQMERLGVPEDTLVYLPGWQGAYDSTHPTYEPRQELGGEDAFRRMVDAIHAGGYRLMIHTTGWGIDPYHPDIEALTQYVVLRPDGLLDGWMVPPATMPPMHRVRLDMSPTELVPRDGGWVASLVVLPGPCEVEIRVTGVPRGTGALKFSSGRRMQKSPDEWFRSHDDYKLPFYLRLDDEICDVRIEAVGGEAVDLSEARLEVVNCYTPPSPNSTWTWPILTADMENKDYAERFVGEVARTVERYDIDAVHVDATGFDWSDIDVPKAEELLRALQARLPDIAICGESIRSMREIGFWALSQNACQSLLQPALDRTRADAAEQGSLTIVDDIGERYAWMNQTSSICEFAHRFLRTYAHLCASHAFSSVGKVCNQLPPRTVPAHPTEHWRILRDASRLSYALSLRVHVQDGTLNDETVEALSYISRMSTL